MLSLKDLEHVFVIRDKHGECSTKKTRNSSHQHTLSLHPVDAPQLYAEVGALGIPFSVPGQPIVEQAHVQSSERVLPLTDILCVSVYHCDLCLHRSQPNIYALVPKSWSPHYPNFLADYKNLLVLYCYLQLILRRHLVLCWMVSRTIVEMCCDQPVKSGPSF